MLSHPSHLIVHSMTVQVAPPVLQCQWHHLMVIFAPRTVWDLPWPCGKILPKSQVCIIHWRLLGMLVPLRPLYHISQVSNLTCIDGHLSAFVPLLYPCSHGPSKWTCWHCGWPHCSSNSSLQVAAAKSTMHHLKTPIFEWTMSDQYDKFKLFCESMESWFHLQAIPDEPDDKGAHLEYMLNFLGTTGHQKWKQLY